MAQLLDHVMVGLVWHVKDNFAPVLANIKTEIYFINYLYEHWLKESLHTTDMKVWTDMHNFQMHISDLSDIGFSALLWCSLCCWNDWKNNIMIILFYAYIFILVLSARRSPQPAVWKCLFLALFWSSIWEVRTMLCFSFSWGGKRPRLLQSRHQASNQRHSNTEWHY